MPMFRPAESGPVLLDFLNILTTIPGTPAVPPTPANTPRIAGCCGTQTVDRGVRPKGRTAA